MHPLLKRQLKYLGMDPAGPPPDEASWRALLARVDATYEQADQDRYTLERSLDVSSQEMAQLFRDLERSSQTQLAAERDKLQISAATLRTTVEAAPDGILVLDEYNHIVMYNRRYFEVWGIAVERAPHMTSSELRSTLAELTADSGAFVAASQAIQASGIASSDDEFVLRDGRILECCSRAVLLPTGTALGRVWFVRDVTLERRAAEETLRAKRFLDSVIENIPDMIFVKDAANLTFVEMNRAGEELLGLSRADLFGKGDAEFFPPDQAEFFIAKDREVLASGTLVEIAEERIETPAGTRFLNTKKIPLCDATGQPQYLLGISRDITDAKHAELQLREAKEAAERASRVKSGFLSNMSHEMRTPLNAILGFAQVIQSGRCGAISDRQREFMDNILRAGRHMLNLVNDLLDLRRLEEDRAAIAATRLELRPMVEEAVQLVRPMADDKQQAVTISLAPELPEALADRRAVIQILVNLLSNAVKFTPANGSIDVIADSTAEAIVLRVVDTGIGIPLDQQSKLFTYFEQLGAKHALDMKGSGIGLALTRALVEKLGGHIDVRSTPGTGSSFEFSIPRWMEAA